MRGSWLGWGALLLSIVLTDSSSGEEPIADPSLPVADLAEPVAAVEEPIIEVRPIRVEGRRLLEPRFRSSDARTVIEREEIEALRPQALVDLLRERAGVDVRSTGGPGKATTLRIRGSTSNQVRVLIDGVPVGSATLGAYAWENLSSLDIERIEILRGPQTTIYGAGAMGGVVQVFTRDPEPGISGSIRAGYGNEGRREAGIRLSGGTEAGVRASFSMERSKINGVSALIPDPDLNPNPEVDPFRNTTTAAQVSAPIGPGRVKLFWRRSDAHTDLDGFFTDNEFFDQDSLQRTFGLDWRHPVNDHWATRLLLSQHDDQLVGEDPNLFFNNYDIETKRRQVAWTNDVAWGDFGFLGGVDHEVDRAVNEDKDIRDGTRRTGVFGQFRFDNERAGASLGVRHEWNSRSEDKWTYQLGGRVGLLEGLDLLANYGTAFRPPTLNELFFTDPFSAGNPDLLPEKSHGGDVGLRWTGEYGGDLHWVTDVRGYYQSYENLIEYRDQGGFFFVPENVEQARMSGAEVSIRIDWKSLWLTTSYTHLRALDSEGLQLQRRSRDAGRLSIGGRWWDRFRAEIVLHAVGRSFSFAGERSPVKGYWLADLYLSVELHKHLTAQLALRNLTNHAYEEVSRQGTLPRMVFVSLEASF